MQRIIERHIDQTVESEGDFISYVYARVKSKNAPHIPMPIFLDAVNNMTDFPQILHTAEQLEEDYKKIENIFSQIL